MITIKCKCGRDILLSDTVTKDVLNKPWGCQTGVVAWAYQENGIVTNLSISHLVMGPPPVGLEWDHKDLDIHNNQEENLRAATRSQNAANRRTPKSNTSGFKGVRIHKRDGLIQAHITVNYKQIHLGSFPTLEEAARAYDRSAKKYFGEFAALNFPDEVQLPPPTKLSITSILSDVI